jgi:NTP pyrophosphatase (non-canonical NTP hydrolase)
MNTTPEQYVKDAVRTEASISPQVCHRLYNAARLLHGAMGLCTEAGEFQDALKKYIFYGKEMDAINLSEEIGDILWYVALICDTLGEDMTSIMERNIAKLRSRYPEKFTEGKALNRSLETERKVLEGQAMYEDDNGKLTTKKTDIYAGRAMAARHDFHLQEVVAQFEKQVVAASEAIMKEVVATVEDSGWLLNHGWGLRRTAESVISQLVRLVVKEMEKRHSNV